MWSSSIRTVTWFLRPPEKRGRYRRTGASRSSFPWSTRRIAEAAVATTLVMEATSQRVESGSGIRDAGFQVKCPYPREYRMESRRPMTTTAPG